jgi:hypothetical protein
MNSWAIHYDRCQECGTTEKSHAAQGLCVTCYERRHGRGLRDRAGRGTGGALDSYGLPIPQPGSHRGELKPSEVAESVLRSLYLDQELSLQDVAERLRCSRQYVLRLMKKYTIPRRPLSVARKNAQRDGKVQFLRQSRGGAIHDIKLGSVQIDRTFFRSWSQEMAYVLGVFCTDGNLTDSGGYYRASISQKQRELLDKCLALMNCDAKLSWCAKRGQAGALYQFFIGDQEVCRDLIRLGIRPRKSRVIRFPEIRTDYVRHFIRGCWDGDGSIYQEGRHSSWNASFISGSPAFAASLHDWLVRLGMPRRTIHCDFRSNAYYFRWSRGDCGKLFHILYDGVPESQYLSRKYERFRAAAAATDAQQQCQQ